MNKPHITGAQQGAAAKEADFIADFFNEYEQTEDDKRGAQEALLRKDDLNRPKIASAGAASLGAPTSGDEPNFSALRPTTSKKKGTD